MKVRKIGNHPEMSPNFYYLGGKGVKGIRKEVSESRNGSKGRGGGKRKKTY